MVADAVYRVILTVCGRGPASLMATLFSGRDLATLQELSVNPLQFKSTVINIFSLILIIRNAIVSEDIICADSINV